MQGKLSIRRKKLAATIPHYISPGQLTLAGFETPFEHKLNQQNRWIKLAHAIPWDKIVPHYDRLFGGTEGRTPISGRVIIGAMIIKHKESLTDRDTIQHITENVYMQYFLGYSSFTDEAPFTAPLFVAIRKRMTLELTNTISDIIATHCMHQEQERGDGDDTNNNNSNTASCNESVSSAITTVHAAANNDETQIKDTDQTASANTVQQISNKGKLLIDATVAPQHITFPTDLKLLNAARKKSEELIDLLYSRELHGSVKPRTYRNKARKLFLNMAKKKSKFYKEIYKANGRQLRYLRRNLSHIDTLVVAYKTFPLKHRDQKYLMVLHTVYQQQEYLYRSRSKSVENRIVNIHQPHVRPIVRGKERNKVEFGSKLQVSLVDGYTFIDKLSWDAFNEGQCLQYSVEQYRKRMGYYPQVVLADKIYCNRANRKWLAQRKIKLSAKPLGRPSATAVANHIRPGDRNPIEGKFGQGKLAYGLDCIKAKLKETSESWIACIALVLNLVNLTRQALLSIYQWIMQNILIQKQHGKNFKIFAMLRVI